MIEDLALGVRPPAGAAGTAPVRGAVLVAGRSEGIRLARHPAVLAGLASAAALIAHGNLGWVPRWWVADVQVGTALILVGMGALLASHLAAGRARRDGMEALYDSYPIGRASRTAAHLLALLGPVAMSGLLVAVSAAWFVFRGVIGSPDPAVVAGGLALVALLGALGVLLGTLAPNVWAGLVAAIVLAAVELDMVVPSYEQVVRIPPSFGWLFPWTQPDVLSGLPGPVGGVPPAWPHLAELAALLALLGAAAYLASRPPRRRLVALVAVVCLAVATAGWSGWVQSRPIPLSASGRVFAAATRPADFQRCVGRGGVTYCAYPAYLPWAAMWSAPVDGVLSRLPRRPRRRLVVRQVTDSAFLCSPALTGLPEAQVCTGAPAAPGSRAASVNHMTERLDSFLNRLSYDAALIPGSARPPVYVGLEWGSGPGLGPSQWQLALSAAYWAVGLPTTGRPSRRFGVLSCLPVGQARAAVAIWLAASSTPAAKATLLGQIADPQDFGPVPYGSHRKLVSTFNATPVAASPVTQLMVTTGSAALLGAEMARLPVVSVERALASHWTKWLDWRTSDSSLAAALGVRLPAERAAPPTLSSPGAVASIAQTPADPVCR